MTLRVRAVLPPRLDPNAWTEQAALGQVPSLLPYGFEHLRLAGIDLTVAQPRNGLIVPKVFRAAAKAHSGYRFAESRSLVRGEQAVTLAWDEFAGVPAACASRKRRSAVASGVIWLTDRPASDLSARVRDGLKEIDYLFVNSSPQVDRLVNNFGVHQDRVEYLPFGIDEDFYKPSKEYDVDFGFVISAGRDVHRDWVSTAQVGSLAAKQGVELKIAARSEVPGQAREFFVGRLSHSEMRQRYRTSLAALICLHANVHSSGVTVALEAMACGTPVIATRQPGLEHYIEDGVTGFLVDQGDISGYIDRIQFLRSNPSERYKLGEASRLAVTERFSTRIFNSALAQSLISRFG